MNLNLSKPQFQFLNSPSKSVLFQAGIGTGKTYVGCLWLFTEMLSYEDSVAIVSCVDYPQVRNTFLPEFTKVLNLFNQEEGKDYRHNKSNNTFTFSNGSKIILCTSNNHESIRGINCSHLYIDECDYQSEESFKVLLGRLRVGRQLLRCTSSPDGFNHIYEFFKDNQVIVAPSQMSLVLSDEYLELLKSSYSPKLYRQEVLAERLALKQGAVYSDFNRDIHVKQIDRSFYKDKEVFFFLDYNISNYCGLFVCLEDGIVKVIEEIHLQNKNTHAMAEEILKRQYKNLIVCGDSAGNNKRDVQATHTNYQIFNNYGLTTKKQTNPYVEKRIITVNSRLYQNEIIINEDCETLIRDLELVSYKKDSDQIDKSDSTLTHMSDAFGYAIHNLLPLKVKKRSTSTNY